MSKYSRFRKCITIIIIFVVVLFFYFFFARWQLMVFALSSLHYMYERTFLTRSFFISSSIFIMKTDILIVFSFNFWFISCAFNDQIKTNSFLWFLNHGVSVCVRVSMCFDYLTVHNFDFLLVLFAIKQIK